MKVRVDDVAVADQAERPDVDLLLTPDPAAVEQGVVADRHLAVPGDQHALADPAVRADRHPDPATEHQPTLEHDPGSELEPAPVPHRSARRADRRRTGAHRPAAPGSRSWAARSLLILAAPRASHRRAEPGIRARSNSNLQEKSLVSEEQIRCRAPSPTAVLTAWLIRPCVNYGIAHVAPSVGDGLQIARSDVQEFAGKTRESG